MEKQQILDRLETIKMLVNNSESAMRLAVISYRKHQEDLQKAMEELDILEEEIKTLKGRSLFSMMFGDPLKDLDFNKKVHEAIEECEGEGNTGN